MFKKKRVGEGWWRGQGKGGKVLAVFLPLLWTIFRCLGPLLFISGDDVTLHSGAQVKTKSAHLLHLSHLWSAHFSSSSCSSPHLSAPHLSASLSPLSQAPVGTFLLQPLPCWHFCSSTTHLLSQPEWWLRKLNKPVSPFCSKPSWPPISLGVKPKLLAAEHYVVSGSSESKT